VPTALNVDGLEWERGKWSRLGRAVFRGGAAIAARGADRLVSDSETVAAVWEERFGVRPDYIPYGADVVAGEDDASDCIARLGIEPGSYVLTVARLVPENNVRMAVEGVAGLDSGRRPLHVIVGSAGPRDQVTEYVRALDRTRADVRWLGHVDDQRLLRQLFRHSLAYVHGHSVGGTNPALLEALGAGAPVVAYDVAFNREVSGPDGLYFGDAAQLTARLAELLESASLRERLAARGRARVSARYAWPDVCRRYLDLLGELAR
jgi:glycosyltransferase involved in cell wall biosynthesis